METRPIIHFIILFFLGIDQKEMVFQHGSKSCHFNKTNLISCEEAKTALLNELNKPDKDLLKEAFQRHCQVLKFKNQNSGLCPFSILTVNIWIDRISPTFFDYAPLNYAEAETE